MKIAVTKERLVFMACLLSGVGVIVSTGDVWAMIGGVLIMCAILIVFDTIIREAYESGREETAKNIPRIVESALVEDRRSRTRIFDGQRWRTIGKDC